MEENRNAEDRMESREQRKKEIREAISAGEAAVRALKDAREALNSAGNWGIWDMIGGGFISSMVKHSKLKDAENSLEEARGKLSIFRRELEDVSSAPEFHLNVGGFLPFADIFLDNLFVDWAVQSKISDAKGQVDSAIHRIQSLTEQLKQMEAE